MARRTRSSDVELVGVGPLDEQLLQQIIALGDLARRTLGFLPREAFRQAAESGTLLAAVSDGQALGYVLYSLPRQVVRLTHLCVADDARGRGIARLLVEYISGRHSDRFGITLKCRNDYAAHGLWPVLGFVAQGEVQGRSKRRLPLTIWWRDHGHPNLFSAAESIGLLRVAIDLNVFLDLVSRSERHGVVASKALAADWLTDQLELVVTGELISELKRMADGQEKHHQNQEVGKFTRLAVDKGDASALAAHVTDRVFKALGVDLATNPSDRSDVLHVAEASLGGVTVMATKDEKLIRWATEALDITGVRAMHPADVVLHVDELSRAQAYQPVDLENTGYRVTQVRSGIEHELLVFQHDSEGERKAEYLELIRGIAAGGPQWSRIVLRSPDNSPIAFYATGEVGEELDVPILRFTSGRLEQTVTRQILFQIRDQARHANRRIIRITDPRLSGENKRILREEGFLKLGGQWVALVICACGGALAINSLVAATGQSVGLRMPTLRPSLSGVIAADLERAMWPVKITDSLLPTYVIPIKPVWSADLFGIPRPLTPRPNIIGLSREHVYYRSSTPPTRAPARLLWYVTDASRGGVAAVVACSRLDESVSDRPATLFQRFRHLGVWQLGQIAKAAKADQAQALRFADTEIFDRRVSLRRLRQLATEHGQTLALRSPQKITPELFEAVYQEGYPRT